METGISYAITVCNEAEELRKLLSLLKSYLRSEDEIVVLVDVGHSTSDVSSVLSEYHDCIKVVSQNFGGNFSSWKNELNQHCTKSWIFQLDADELPTEYLLTRISEILGNNSNVDLIWIPRINFVEGLTSEDIEKWHWKLGSDARVNWPDFQGRIYRNSTEICWQGKVHERITGHHTFAYFPLEDKYALMHIKSINKQRKQNEYYATIR